MVYLGLGYSSKAKSRSSSKLSKFKEIILDKMYVYLSPSGDPVS